MDKLIKDYLFILSDKVIFAVAIFKFALHNMPLEETNKVNNMIYLQL